MPIELQDLRSAVRDYIDSKVSVTVSSILPVTGDDINAGEYFKFNLTATNTSASSGGVQVKNIRFYVSVADPVQAKLIVPATTTAKAYGDSGLKSVLNPNDEVSSMYLTLPTGDTVLTTGDSDSITSLRGKARVKGTFTIKAALLVDPDLDYMFPVNEQTPTVSKSATILE